MKVLNDGSWSNLISDEHFVQLILEAVISSWTRIRAPAEDEYEDPVNRRLCGALQNDPAHRRLPFHVISQWEDIDADGNLLGKPDIRFMPKVTYHEDEFLVVECKRLRYRRGTKQITANAAYIDGDNQGMTAFVDGRYPTPRGRAGMVGYVFVPARNPVGSLQRSIQSKRVRLSMPTQSKLKPTKWNAAVYETPHDCSSGRVTLYHLVLDASVCSG